MNQEDLLNWNQFVIHEDWTTKMVKVTDSTHSWGSFCIPKLMMNVNVAINIRYM